MDHYQEVNKFCKQWLTKQKQQDGEDIGMFGESYLRMIEVERSSNTKEVHVTFVEKKEND